MTLRCTLALEFQKIKKGHSELWTLIENVHFIMVSIKYNYESDARRSAGSLSSVHRCSSVRWFLQDK